MVEPAIKFRSQKKPLAIDGGIMLSIVKHSPHYRQIQQH